MRLKAKRIRDGFLIPMIHGLEDKEEIEVEIKDLDYIEKFWREIALGTHTAELEDDELLFQAYWRFQNEKHID